MRWPAWLSRDWRLYAGGGGVLALVALSIRAAPSVGAPLPGASSGSGPSRVFSASLVPVKGSTYFAAVMTHGSANVATSSMVADYARSHGFVDVVVSTAPIPGWPPMPPADFYVRGTYAAATPETFPRRKGIVLGSVEVLDVWAA